MTAECPPDADGTADRGLDTATMALGFPEHGRLRRVLMHAPGEELDLIRPASFRRFLFEDAIEPGEFRRQHQRLVDLLRAEGVEVLLIGDLLAGSPLLEVVRKSPNLLYTRDTVAVTRAGSIAMRMRSPVRRHEPRIATAALAIAGVPALLDIQTPATMEGGDLIFLDGDTLLLGVGNRTSRIALTQLRRRIPALRRVVAVELPPWAIHLDGTMMVVDQDLAIVHRESVRRTAYIHEDGRRPRRTTALEFLKGRGFRIVEVTAYERSRRATNLITLAPGRLIGYAGNARVRRLLRDAGVEMIEIEGSELLRGGGGPRCMTAPIERDAATPMRRGAIPAEAVG